MTTAYGGAKSAENAWWLTIHDATVPRPVTGSHSWSNDPHRLQIARGGNRQARHVAQRWSEQLVAGERLPPGRRVAVRVRDRAGRGRGHDARFTTSADVLPIT